MPRLPRFVLPNAVHHVVARGVNKTRIFQSGFEKDRYLKRFALIAEDEKVLIHGFCLMDNHVHWLLTPTTQRGLARLFQRAHTWWAVTYNQKHGRTGHLFQSRYHSVPLDEKHYWDALRYVELNPKEANLVDRAEDWEHSSARAHLTGRKHAGSVKLASAGMRRRYSPHDWRFFLGEYDPMLGAQLLAASAGCRPWGSGRWLASLERKHGRRFTPRLNGRPRRAPVHSKTRTNSATTSYFSASSSRSQDG